MAKIFFLIIVVIFIFWIIKIQKIQKNKTQDSLEPIEDMVSCVHCNTHIPKKEAVIDDENQYFCSVIHRDEYKKT